MAKITLGPGTFLYPMPTTLVGANVDGKANFLAIAYCGIVQHTPPLIAVTLGKKHYTNQGVKDNKTFSVNIPSQDMAEVTDYMGIKSGRQIDKSSVFTVYYGKLSTAPLIEEAPLALECELVQTLDFGGTNEVFIGRIVQAYADEEVLTDDLPDMSKLRPLLFSMHDNSYWSVGERIGKAWSMGLNYEERNK